MTRFSNIKGQFSLLIILIRVHMKKYGVEKKKKNDPTTTGKRVLALKSTY